MLRKKKMPFKASIALCAAVILAGCAHTEKVVVLDSDVSFGFGSAQLTPAGQKKIDQYAATLLNSGEIRLEIVGHSDRIGDSRANQVLSERRAQSVRDQLLTSSLKSRQITARGAGATDPVVYCDRQGETALIACLAPNRRVEIKVTTIGA